MRCRWKHSEIDIVILKENLRNKQKEMCRETQAKTEKETKRDTETVRDRKQS